MADTPQPAPVPASAPAPASPPATAPAAAPASPADVPKVTRPTRLAWAIMLVVILIGVALILWAWRLWPFTTATVVTEDAYVKGRVTNLAPQVNGYVTEVLVADYQYVKAGQPLFRIDDRLYQQQVTQNQAQLAKSQADLDNVVQTIAQNQATIAENRADLMSKQAERDRANADATRVGDLASRGSVSMRERDTAQATARGAVANVLKAQAVIRSAEATLKATQVSREGLTANVAASRAQLRTARINLANTVIVAPSDGQVSEASVRRGQYVAAGSQLLYIVPKDVWVVANYKETQIRHMRIGQSAWFTADALGDAKLRGHVEQVSPATGSEFSVLKADNASGNFTKVVQRVPVRIHIDSDQALAQRLRPGMSVIVHVNTSGDGLPEPAR
ncbi:MAG: HlyD family secretion protein [Janthinobacterium lividum]